MKSYCMDRITVSKLTNTVSPPVQSTAPMGSINPAAVRRSFSGDAFLNPTALGVAGLQQPLEVNGDRQEGEDTDKNPMAFPQYTGCRYDRDKPAYSYASLIAQAILDTPDRKLTLNQIYHWIMNKYPYYRSQNSGWQNSIRHNLSLNKCFTKVERQGNENGKGAYWTIQPDQLPYFQDGAFRRRRATSQECEKRNGSRKRRRCDTYSQGESSDEEEEEDEEVVDNASWVADEVLFEDYDDPNMPALEWTPINGLAYAEGVEKIVNRGEDGHHFGMGRLGSELDWSFMTGGNILTSDLLLNIRF